MRIDAISMLQPELVSESVAKPPQSDFSQWLSGKVKETNQQLINSDNKLQDLAAGKVDNLHQVMIQFEQAKLSLSLISQVRNRALTAYQDILKQQI